MRHSRHGRVCAAARRARGSCRDHTVVRRGLGQPIGGRAGGYPPPDRWPVARALLPPRPHGPDDERWPGRPCPIGQTPSGRGGTRRLRPGRPHWSGRSMAEATGRSKSTVRRIGTSFHLPPPWQSPFQLSPDACFPASASIAASIPSTPYAPKSPLGRRPEIESELRSTGHSLRTTHGSSSSASIRCLMCDMTLGIRALFQEHDVLDMVCLWKEIHGLR